MNKFIISAFTATLVLSAFNISAATTSENTDDGSSLGTADNPQVKEQNKDTHKVMKKSIAYKKHTNQSKIDMKMMDTNNDGMVSKDEYMSYHDKAYGTMKQTNGEVSNSDMKSAIASGFYKNSMNNKPIGTTSGTSNNGSTDDTKVGEPINGTTTGTN